MMCQKSLGRLLCGGAIAAAMWCGVAFGQVAVPADQPLPPDPVGEELQRALMEANIPPMPREAVPLPVALPIGNSAWINAQRDTRAARMTVYSAAHRAKYGPFTAASGRALVVLDVELVNIIPYTLISQQQIPTEYRIPNLA